MTLGEYIEKLESMDPEIAVEVGLGNPHSWRGNYSELAFETVPNTTIGEMLDEAKSALGKTFYGYKGGKFRMSKYSDVHVDNNDQGDSLALELWLNLINEIER